MRYSVLSNFSIFILSILISILVAVLVSINSWYLDLRYLPKVYQDKTGACVKVDNYENGHAFTCQDLNVLLRRYRTATIE